WGTSKAYVIGLAFAVAGYSSFWLIAMMCILMALVGVNYMAICRHYPDGGGVYASVRHRSEVISIVGAFLLIADYIVTASISALSAFQYIGVHHPEFWAGAAILFIGFLNYFGPKHTGGLAFIVSLPTVVVVILLSGMALPHLGQAVHELRPLSGNLIQDWTGFVSIVLALSGVEAVANATGVMKLDPGSTDERPSVVKTSTPAIAWVMLEVCIFTALLGLAMHALPGLSVDQGEVDAPGHPGVRDYMLRYMAEVFARGAFGPLVGQIAGWVVSVVIGVLLLSAVNTAIVGLIAIFFMMSRDGEIPARFEQLNGFGVPNLGLLVATLVPAFLVIAVRDVSGLADLYAVGVVGAIATNLGSTSTDRSLHLERWERVLMFGTFIIMSAIEISLFVVKPNARVFCAVILSVGLLLHGLASERARKRRDREAAATASTKSAEAAPPLAVAAPILSSQLTGEEEFSSISMICAVRGVGRTLDFALDEARSTKRPLYLLFVREQPVLLPEDRRRKWHDDDEARSIFGYANERAKGVKLLPCYAVSDSAADTIVEVAATVGATYLILGAPQRSAIVNLLRGNIIRSISDILPEEIHLLVYA
ncbi:MAG: amino acid permease, partial [Verrucomicrobia bacterium]|nr:amino acid permease [Verrucomicrobiota bacterium]